MKVRIYRVPLEPSFRDCFCRVLLVSVLYGSIINMTISGHVFEGSSSGNNVNVPSNIYLLVSTIAIFPIILLDPRTLITLYHFTDDVNFFLLTHIHDVLLHYCDVECSILLFCILRLRTNIRCDMACQECGHGSGFVSDDD